MRIRTFYGAILLLSLLASAQQKPVVPGIGATIDVSIVNVDVFVTDKAGNRVRGLTKDDFEIYENGVKQPITNFAEYGEAPHPDPLPASRGEGVSISAQPQRRTVIVFVERFYLPKFRTDPLFASMKQLLHQTIRPGDRATIVTWNRGVLLTHQDFTDSRSALDRSLDRIAELSSKPFIDPTAETRWSIEDIRAFDAQAAAIAGGMPAAGDTLADLELQHAAEKEIVDLTRKIRAINALMRAVAGAEGKKIMLLATRRLSLEAGAEHYYATGASSISAEKRQRLDMREQLKTISTTANANGITIYPVFPEGLTSAQGGFGTSSPADYLILNNETPALKQIAEATGGVTAWGSEDVAKMMPRVREDLDTYYSLAYRVQGTGTDKARNIEVRVKEKGLRVRSRREFMEKSEGTRMEDRVIAALFNNPPSPGFPLRVEVGRRRERGSGFVVPIAVHIPVAVLTALPNGKHYEGAFSVYFAWGGKIGGISETKRDTKPFRIPAAEIEKARAEGRMTYEFDLAYDPRTERVALGVLDEVSKEYALRLIQLKR
jgi:VWFA-related protein